MSFMVPLALFAWIPLTLGLFMVLPARRAAFAALIAGWLFLPMAVVPLSWAPNISKSSVIAYGLLMGVFLFDGARLMAFRPRWFDVPIAVWCLAPIASSILNGQGPYDGFVASFNQMLEWGAPYLMGRLYAADLEGLRELAIAVVIGGLVYVPLCLWEVRMSPQLHSTVYGFHQHSFMQTYRMGGYRPMVFMQHGLALGLWMTVATLCAFWLWYTGAVRRLRGVPMVWVVGVLGVTAVLCKSLGALMLLAAGVGVLTATKSMRTRLAVACLVAVPVLYIGVRSTQMWSGQGLVDLMSATVGPSRASSVEFRLGSEDVLVDWAWRQPVFGWGGWGRNRPDGIEGHTVTDGLWVIALGQRGWVGLAALWTFLILPMVLLLSRLRAPEWRHPAAAPAVALGVSVLLFAIDGLLNAMPVPVYFTAAGGVIGCMGTMGARRAPAVGVGVVRPGTMGVGPGSVRASGPVRG